MADLARPALPISVDGTHSVPAIPTIGRKRRIAGYCLLVLATFGLAFAGWSRVYRPQGWLGFVVDRYLAPKYEQLVIKRLVLPKPHEVYTFVNAVIPKEQIVFGTPDIDDIPSLVEPEFLPAAYGTHVYPNDRVIGIAVGDFAKAYPLKILAYHEAVNDRLGEVPVLVTYCVLCDSAVVFSRSLLGSECEFGISGMLFNSNTLLYSRSDETPKTLWSQLKCQAVSGPQAGTTLVTLPLELTTWSDWCRRFPKTKVLSKFTHHEQSYNYQKNPVGNYLSEEKLLFPVEPSDSRLPRKAKVLGVWTANVARAYPLAAFSSWTKAGTLEQTLDGKQFTLHYDPSSQNLRIIAGDESIQRMYALWFAWHAFHPQAELYETPANESASLQ